MINLSGRDGNQNRGKFSLELSQDAGKGRCQGFDLNSPVITCSPSPCVFSEDHDGQIKGICLTSALLERGTCLFIKWISNRSFSSIKSKNRFSNYQLNLINDFVKIQHLNTFSSSLFGLSTKSCSL